MATVSLSLKRRRSRPPLDRLELENRRRILRCVLALLVVLAGGASGFIWTEGWGPWQSLYFTLITITTVGYSDEGISPQGKQFAVLLLLVGIATTTYCMSSLVQIVVSRQLRWKRRMQRQIDQLSQHVIVCGYGRVGRTVAEQLLKADIPFVIIEQNEQHYQEAVDRGLLALHGNATEDTMLKAAGISRARAVVCLLDSDAENVFITLSARDFNPKAFIVCRAETESAAGKAHRAGAEMVVSPYYAAGVDVATAVIRPNLAQFLEHGRSEPDGFDLTEITIERGSPLVGKTVAEVGQGSDTVVFVALKQPDGQTIIRPPGGLRFDVGDILFLAGSRESLEQFRQVAKPRRSFQQQTTTV